MKISAEWIYFLPTFDQPDYVTKGFDLAGDKDIERNRIDQQFCPGYRIEAELDMDCIPNLIFGYTYFDQELTASKSSPIIDLSSTLGSVIAAQTFNGVRGEATLNERFKFDSVDGLAQIINCKFNKSELKISAGVKYARLHFTNDFFMLNSANSRTLNVIDNLTSIAVGPQIRFHGAWQLASCLKICGRLQGGMLASAVQTKLDQSTTRFTPNFNQKYTESPEWFWHVVKNIDTRIGFELGTKLSLPRCSYKLPISFEAGYELFYIPRFVSRMCFFDAFAEGLSTNEWSSFTMQGPYVRGNISF